MKLFVEKRKSAKSGKEYSAIYCVVRGHEYMLSIDSVLIKDLLDFKPSELESLQVGKKVEILLGDK